MRGVLLTGTMGSGKTVIAVELGELLSERRHATAVLDLDWLAWFHPARGNAVDTGDLICRNVAAVWPSFRELGARYAVLARAVHDRGEVEALRSALPDVDLTVVRLTSTRETIERRLRARDIGSVLDEHLVHSARLSAVLDETSVADVEIHNDETPPRAVAMTLLQRIGWS